MNEFATAILSGIASEAVKPIFRELYLKAGNKLEQRRAEKIKSTLESYIARSYEKLSKTKTLLYSENPVNLKSYYVRTDLQSNGKKVRSYDLIGHLAEQKRIVISGTAGSGKSTFCKSIFLDIIENNKKGILPIFFELRQLNLSPELSLTDHIVQTISATEDKFSKSQFEDCIKSGKLLLIFDGLDEINHDLVEKFEREILTFSNSKNNISIIISSREDERFNHWEEFRIYKVLPLNKKKAIELIEKLEYDTKTKEIFIKDLNDKIYEKHKSFASNPLLLTMMLLTYSQIAEIPDKIHLFYDQAFLTLFSKHDSFKSLYKRKQSSNLPLDSFKKVLSAFCATSLIDQKYYFEANEIKNYIEAAKEITEIDVDTDSFLKDLRETVCVIQRDGTGYTFTHRSFQEYFTSLFIVNSPITGKFKLIDHIAKSSTNSLVIPMAFDINKEMIEKEWIIPKIKKITQRNSKYGKSNYDRLNKATAFFDSVLALIPKKDETQKAAPIAVLINKTMPSNNHYEFFIFIQKLYLEKFNNYLNKKTPNIDKNCYQIIASKLVKGNADFGQIKIKNIKQEDKELIDAVVATSFFFITETTLNFIEHILPVIEEANSRKDKKIMELLS